MLFRSHKRKKKVEKEIFFEAKKIFLAGRLKELDVDAGHSQRVETESFLGVALIGISRSGAY